MAVNLLPLDRYLRGVVPWEVPKGWHEATYEAQAVAARSYTLATLKPGEDFDLYPDTRSQMYGGIRAERPQTNLAVGATAGQVLTWGGRSIPAFYFSTSGGSTSSVHDAWPKARQVPYLVSVRGSVRLHLAASRLADHACSRASRIGAALRLRDVRDAVVVRNSSGRAQAVRLLTAHGWKRFGARAMRTTFKLGSTDFELRAMTLDAAGRAGALRDARARARLGARARQGAAAGAGEHGWQTVAPIHADAERPVHRVGARAALDAVPARLQRARRRCGHR